MILFLKIVAFKLPGKNINLNKFILVINNNNQNEINKKMFSIYRTITFSFKSKENYNISMIQLSKCLHYFFRNPLLLDKTVLLFLFLEYHTLMNHPVYSELKIRILTFFGSYCNVNIYLPIFVHTICTSHFFLLTLHVKYVLNRFPLYFLT